MAIRAETRCGLTGSFCPTPVSCKHDGCKHAGQPSLTVKEAIAPAVSAGPTRTFTNRNPCVDCQHVSFCDEHGCDLHRIVQDRSTGAAVLLRPEVVAFAIAMEQKLTKNDHKRGWRELPIEALFRQFMLEVEEFKVADEFLTVAESRSETVDLANYALILWDRLSAAGIDPNKNRHEQGAK